MVLRRNSGVFTFLSGGGLGGFGGANCLLVALFLFFACFLTGGAHGSECTRTTAFGSTEKFVCPKRGDDYDKTFCCGHPLNQKCCDAEDFQEEHPEAVGVAVAIIIIFFLLLIGAIILAICCCCSCCYLAKRRTRRGVVLSGQQPTTVITTGTTPSGYTPYPQQAYYQPVVQSYPPVPPVSQPLQPTEYQKQNSPFPEPAAAPLNPTEYTKPPPYYQP